MTVPIDLPTRESYKRSGVTLYDVEPVLREYVKGNLLTRDEAVNDEQVRRTVANTEAKRWIGLLRQNATPHRIGTTQNPSAQCLEHNAPVYDRLQRFCEYAWQHRPEVVVDAYPGPIYASQCRIEP